MVIAHPRETAALTHPLPAVACRPTEAQAFIANRAFAYWAGELGIGAVL